MKLVYTAITLFAIAALIGLYLISHVLQRKKPSKTAAVIHGLFAATALVLIIVRAAQVHGGLIVQAIVLFVLAALGGLTLFVRDINGKTLPGWLAIVHALIAVSGFVFLVVYALKQP